MIYGFGYDQGPGENLLECQILGARIVGRGTIGSVQCKLGTGNGTDLIVSVEKDGDALGVVKEFRVAAGISRIAH